MLARRLVVCFLWSVSAAAAAAGGADDNFGDVAGLYGSTKCVLELKRDGRVGGRYLLACTDAELREGRAAAIDGGVVLLNAVRHTNQGVLWPPQDIPGSDWPGVRDPTVGPWIGPSVVGGSEASVRLRAVRWGERLYLVRPEERGRFCGSVRSGAEPRKTGAGDQLLRRGDQRKRAGVGAPQICLSSEE
jgi:hypothetical protein